MYRSLNIKSLAVAVSALVLSTSVNAALISTTAYFSGDNNSMYDPNTSYNGYVIGIGANENGSDRAVISSQGFDSTLGELVSVSLSYGYTSTGYLWAGAFTNVVGRPAGYTATASHQGALSYGFDSVFTTELENTTVNTSTAGQRLQWGTYSVPWNTAQLWTGNYVYGYDRKYSSYNKNNVINFDSSLFDNFINQTFQLELLSTTFNSSITGCNYLNTCGMSTSTQTYLTHASLIYTYDDGISAVPVPGAVWLFGSGLIGLIGVARRKKA